ncbi:MAG: putative bifunctional diguanylate cyclase/phosphodiesterase [bacterium]
MSIDMNSNKYNIWAYKKLGQHHKDRLVHYIKAIIGLVSFLVSLYILKHDIEIVFNDYTVNTISLRGIIVHLQIIISVFLVVETVNWGYIISGLLNIFAIIFALMGLFQQGEISNFVGITSYILSLILIIILQRYRKRLYNQFELFLEQKRELEHMVFYDCLTDIPNRKKVIDLLNSLISRSSSVKNKFTLVFIDIDNFKKINDFLGYYVGDCVLQMIVNRINSLIHEDDILGRMGGDEFALIIPRDLCKEKINEYLEELKNIFSEGFTYENKDIYLKASFGVTIYPRDGNSSEELLKSADIAMYNAKSNSNRSIEFFSRSLKEGFIHNIKLEDGLKSAIKKEELYLVYQPQFSSGDKLLRGFEVLLRWDSLELGAISPAQFIPVAEKTGMITEIGEWVLRNSIIEFKKNCPEYYDINLMLSINISVAQLLDSNFIIMVKKVLEETGFNSNYLEFEMTESIFISYPEYVMMILTQLKNMGISLALDDFGTGYASLSFLQNIAIDVLKVDKIFINTINKYNKKKDNIVGPIIKLAHQLEIMVVAEGVENTNQLSFLQDHSCDYIQGYLLGKPVQGTYLNRVINKSYNESPA